MLHSTEGPSHATTNQRCNYGVRTFICLTSQSWRGGSGERKSAGGREHQLKNCCSLPGSPSGLGRGAGMKKPQSLPKSLATGCLFPHSPRLPSALPVLLLCGSRTKASRSWERCGGSAAIGCRGQLCPLAWLFPALSAHRAVGGLCHVPFSAEMRWGYPGLLHAALGV